MSIKKLFDTPEKSTNYLGSANEKDAFKDAESSKNIKQIKEKQDYYLPKVDYSNPANFAKFGSAYLYYQSAFTRIVDFYPYDGSDAEINDFYNGCLDIEKYILDNKYPRTTGYAMLSKGGWGTLQGEIEGYGIPVSAEYITFEGGPGTGISGSAEGKVSTPSQIKNLSTMGPDALSDNPRGRANIYDTDIYETEGLPSGYGKGTRTSNIRANFDDGVTVEFWLQANSPPSWAGAGTITTSEKQVLFDWHNGNAPNDAEGDYGRIIIEMTSSTSVNGGALNPFILTVQSGNVTTRNLLTLGDPSLHSTHLDGNTWSHYAFKIFNSGSTLKANLYVDGHFADENSWGSYDLSSSMCTQIISGSGKDTAGGASDIVAAVDYTYSSQGSLQGWWRLRGDNTDYLADHSGKGRNAESTDGPDGSSLPASPVLSYVQQTDTTDQKSRVFGASAQDHMWIGTCGTWDALIGQDTPGGSTKKMTFSTWVYKTGDGGNNEGRILDFGENDVYVYTSTTDRLYLVFNTWDGSDAGTKTQVQFRTKAAALPNPAGTPGWRHVVITADLSNTYVLRDGSGDDGKTFLAAAAGSPGAFSDLQRDIRMYVDGIEVDVEIAGGSIPADYVYYGIRGTGLATKKNCYIGNDHDKDRGWEGNLADVAIWNDIISSEEVKAIFNAADSKWHTKVNTPITELNPKNAKGRIGALLYPIATAPDNTGMIGGGKLTGSIDEFRYWKTGRSAEEIGANWFDQVRGGANSDISNASLGVYYKFNEGITATSSVDRIVLDYAGRVTNGHWAGYTSVSRNTGSAILSASAAIREYEDPIIRTNHPKISELKESLLASGSNHDYNNNGSFLSLLPGWIVDNEETITGSDLQNMAHIAGAYFDKLYLQIAAVPSLRHITYTSASHKPTSFAEHLPQSLGLYSPQMFVESDIIERFLNKNDQKLFEGDLDETKNLIYSNLYNNLANIYKSKGTEKSIRNVLRCFNVDEKLIRLNVRSNDREFVLSNNLEQVLVRKPMVNFASSSQSEAVVYQRHSPHHSDGLGYIACENIPADVSSSYGFTAEVGIIFPSYNESISKLNRNYYTASLFGIQSVDSTNGASKKGTDPSFVAAADNFANFQVRAIKQEDAYGRPTKNIKFQLTQSYVPTGFTFPELTSSIFMGAYDNQYWNISVRVRPVSSSVNYAFMSSSVASTVGAPPAYEVIFKGINTLENEILNSFEVSGTFLPYNTVGGSRAASNTYAGQKVFSTPKRLYIGAERTNINGAVLYKSDVMVPYARFWLKSLDDYSLLQHAYDMENLGISGSNDHLSPLDPSVAYAQAADQTDRSTLALNWNFLDVTGSNASGEFYTQDFSSGSVENRTHFGWLGQVSTGYQHTGYGYGFITSSAAAIKKEPVNTYRFMDPESVVSSDMIKLFDDSDKLFDPTETPPNFIYALEKSPYAAVSEEILDFFAGAIDFHNLIGNPVNKYRERYKEMEKLRQTFFRRVSKVSDVEKYIEYYKWFDTALSSVISQLVPASANFIEDTQNIIESHVLERNKYKHQLPIIKKRTPELSTYLQGNLYTSFGWGDDVSSVPASPRSTLIRERYWKTEATASAPEITSGDANIDAGRDIIRKVVRSTPRMSGSSPKRLKTAGGTIYTRKHAQADRFTKNYNWSGDITNVIGSGAIGGGVNFNTVGKNFAYAYNAVYPGGPVNREGGRFVPMNVLMAFSNELVNPKNVVNEFQPPGFVDKSKKIYKLNHARDWESGLGYSNVKSDVGFPFNIISSSVQTAANKLVWDRMGANIEITNLHNDVYGDDLEVPMQSPFTQYAVGGHQSRHVPLNKKLDTNTFYSSGLDNYLTRPEAWKILIGSCGPTAPTGAIALVGPDYPWPEANAVDEVPYPMTGAQKAWLYRDFVAKRPLNFKTIKLTGSAGGTILGNYRKTYDYIQIAGAHSNPRKFVEKQPNLPSVLDNTDTTVVRTFLATRRDAQSHTPFIQEYSTNYLTGTEDNSSIITSRFSAPGGIDVMSLGYRDFRSTEYSVYNVLPFKNLSVIKKSQGSSGSVEPVGSTPSEARVYDIHGKDFGMRSHFARHSARFGRDSLTVTDPGASYDQLPSQYKIHRNNQTRMKICDVKLVPIYSGCATTNTSGAYFISNTNDTVMVNTSSATAHTFLTSSRANGGLSFAGWIRFTSNAAFTTDDVNIWGIGRSANSDQLFLFQKNKTAPAGASDCAGSGSGNSLGFKLSTRSTNSPSGGGTRRSIEYRAYTSGIDDDQWHHIAVVLSGANGSLNTTLSCSFYVDGVKQFTCRNDTNTIQAFYDQKIENFGNNGFMGWSQGETFDFSNTAGYAGDEFLAIGGNGFTRGNQTNNFSGSMDQLTFWVKPLTDANITDLYNSGVPCDVTCSSVHTSDTSALHIWLPLGEGHSTTTGTAYYDSSAQNNGTAFASASNAIWDMSGKQNNFWTLSTQGNATNDLRLSNGTGYTPSSVLGGCTAPFVQLREEVTYCTSSVYDNWNVKHQIPRTDIQYAWLSRSLSDPHNIRYNRMQNFGNVNWIGYYSTSVGYLPFYNFVSASDVGNLSNLGGGVQPVLRVNTLTLDAYSSSTNTIGFTTSTTGSDYINTSLNSANNIENGSYLNLLLARRSAKYGWTWRSTRRDDTLVSINSYKNKTLSAVTSSDLSLSSFRLPPVSVRGRPVIVNFDSPVAAANNTEAPFNNASFKATHNNERIYFNEPELNSATQINPNFETTPYEQLVKIANGISGYKLNWILYSQNIFPSLRNEFFSGTTSRTGYDNEFWRDARADRTIDLYGTYASTWTYNSIRADRAILSEWALDAPADFLTRTGPPKITNVGNWYNLRRLNSAGELQNTYYSYFTGSMDQKTGATYNTYINGGAFGVPYSDYDWVFDIMDQQTISGLYARKHMNSARYSAATPCGVRMNGTGGYGYYPDYNTANRSRESANTNTFKTGGVFFPIQTYAGEALWEAGTTAGVWEYSQSNNANSTSSIFLSHSSAPWKFDTYSDYIEDLNLVARGYSIVPEYRISDHVEDYVRYGILNKGKTNTFSIPGTGINSSTGSFYKDYSNSEFMKEFLNIRADAVLGAKEIKLVCSAAIRYNPYKGFYPAQRTLDLTGRFMNSYLSYMNASFTLDGKTVVDANLDPYRDGGNFAPMWRTLFAPGIMYNSIKSGMAVDYPIVLDPTKIGRKQDYAGLDEACGLYSPLNTSGTTNIYGYKGGTYFDKRLPFETMINPTDHLDGLSFFDLESHMSMSLPVTCSWTNGGGDVGLYPMMASNFFGEVGNFFLKDSTFTRLESNVVSDDLKFREGEVYGARVRIMASSDGSRMYNRERDARKKDNAHNPDTANSGAYSDFGARAFTASAPSTNPYQGGYAAYSGAYFPIPQDPKNLAFYEFKKNFNLYSRPTAFGPPISGRSHSNAAAALTASLHGCYDSFEGYNWAFTPPYTNGEAWADLIFRPSASVSYDLEKILAETQVVYWRCDPGAPSGSGYSNHITNLIYGGPGSDIASNNPIYSGPNINPNAMQLSASFNLFGVERVFKTTNDRFGNETSVTNESVGKKWIIQPKFETPMMNFTDEDTQYASDPTLRPISSVNGTLTLPIFGSASVPRGMWHQFGTAMEEPDKGVFVDIGPIPAQWLKYHYRVLNTGSLYNNYNVSESRKNLFKDMKSLTDIANFQKTGQQKRLGELKDSMSIHEAVVAIPYILEVPKHTDTSNLDNRKRKKFINIPKKRFDAAMAKVGSKKGDSLNTAGKSIRELVQKMDKYILPPQFDFKNNKKIKPFVMYIFEFKYEFDQDDLSYIWQNIAPRNSDKMSFQTTAVAHSLMRTELLNENNLLQNENLRWMVFKIKQRSDTSYYDLIPDQAAQASQEIFGVKTSKEGYKLQYNWPYDYLSFVELIKMDAQILYRTDLAPPEKEPDDKISDLKTKQEALEVKKNMKRAQKRAGMSSGGPPSVAGGPARNTRRQRGRRRGGGNQGGGNQGGGNY